MQPYHTLAQSHTLCSTNVKKELHFQHVNCQEHFLSVPHRSIKKKLEKKVSLAYRDLFPQKILISCTNEQMTNWKTKCCRSNNPYAKYQDWLQYKNTLAVYFSDNIGKKNPCGRNTILLLFRILHWSLSALLLITLDHMVDLQNWMPVNAQNMHI